MSSKDSLFKIAIDKLNKENLTLCLYNGHDSYTSNKKGIIPLLELINQKRDFSTFISVDKVIGKAAAFLYIILNIKDIYCFIISKPALEIFDKYEINVRYETLVPNIRNRKNNGSCPMESLVLNINDPNEALNLLIKMMEF